MQILHPHSGVYRLFAMGFNINNIKRNSADPISHRRYYLPRMEIKNYNFLMDGRNFYDQNINNSITRYNELLKLTTGKSEDYATGCLIDYDWYIKDFNIVSVDVTQPACDVPRTSPEGRLKVLMSGTSRGPSGDSQGTNTKIDDLMKKLFFRCNSPCFTHLFLIFTEKNKYSKVINGDVHGTSTGSSCVTSRGPNDGTFGGRLRDVGHKCF